MIEPLPRLRASGSSSLSGPTLRIVIALGLPCWPLALPGLNGSPRRAGEPGMIIARQIGLAALLSRTRCPLAMMQTCLARRAGADHDRAPARGGPARIARDWPRPSARGCSARPKTLPWEYFYDAEGSALFEQICELPEYYLTRTEDAILRDHAPEMVAGLDGDPALIELGSGSASKTRRLIAAALEHYGTLHYVPIDVSPTILEESAQALVRLFPGLRVTGHVASYRTGLASLAARIPGPSCSSSSARASATTRPTTRPGCSARWPAALGPGRPLLARHRPGQGPRRCSRRPTTTPRA